MQIVSPAFKSGEDIPRRFTCEGDDLSPQLRWTGAPKETHSFALVMHDPDAPRHNGFTHWVMYNIPPNVNALDENVSRQPEISGLGLQGKNDGGEIGYKGPCPNTGRHRYIFWLFSLRANLDLEAGATYAQLKEALEGKIIEQAELMGTYAKGAEQAA